MPVIAPSTVIYHTDYYWSINGLSNQLDWFVLYVDSNYNAYWRSIGNATDDLALSGNVLTIGRWYQDDTSKLYFFLITSLNMGEMGVYPKFSHSLAVSPALTPATDGIIPTSSTEVILSDVYHYPFIAIHMLAVYDLNYKNIYVGMGFNEATAMSSVIKTYFHIETDSNTSQSGLVWDKVWKITKGNSTDFIAGAFYKHYTDNFYITEPKLDGINYTVS
jgi:hypothetical protein